MSATEKGVECVKDEKGVRCFNDFFGIGVNLYSAGVFETTEPNGNKKTVQFRAGQKISLQRQWLKLSAAQMLYLRDILNTPAFVQELQARVKAEREAAALNFAVLGD